MLPESKQVLNVLYEEWHKQMLLEEIVDTCELPEWRVRQALASLERQGKAFTERRMYQDADGQLREGLFCTITEEARYEVRHKFERVMEFLFKSILVPLAVAWITALLAA